MGGKFPNINNSEIMAKSKVAAKVQQTAKPSLAEQLKMKAQEESSLMVLIPITNLLNFDPQNPETETVLIFGQPRKVLKWEVIINRKKAYATFQVGQIARLYDFILREELPTGVSLSDEFQAICIFTDKFSTNQRGVKTPNGSAGFLNLSPLTVAASGVQQQVSGYTFAE